VCGDTFVQPTNMEQCDDGNMSNTDLCVQGCKTAACGDSFVQQGVEQCDDGNMVQTDTCINTCKTAACGDGFVQPSNAEQCDDANMSNTDACVGACKTAVCGDGFVRAGVEQCDDANMSNSDACVQGCLTAKCGDGFVRAGVEQCDDGNQNNADGCSNTCTTPMCGNGVVDGAEECDDGNQSNLDACSTECLTIRSKVMVCGSTSRPVNTFFPAGYNFMVVNSCAPDAQTQALFVHPRQPAINGPPALQAYVNAGGIVLTEHNISDEVWTLAFTPTAQMGVFTGGCQDTIPSVVQFNPGDKVWTKVPYQAFPIGQSGCGYFVNGYTGITLLTGWAVNQASTGYRDLGLGRVYATDFDWQDNENYPYAVRR
jgi:cysteine-rich repeat protein